jgi:hypothetical protein
MSKSVANKTQSVSWRNRIIGHTDEDPAQLLANPLNFRRHPGNQRDALRGSIHELGWIKAVLVNKVTGHVIDGHARCEEAISAGKKVPVDWVEMSIDEERLALAVLDPITEMATRDNEALAALLVDVKTDDDGVQRLLDQLIADSGATLDPTEGRDDSGGAERVPMMKFGDYQIPLTAEESVGLGRMAEKYAEAHGAYYGFAAFLVDNVQL